MTISPQSVDARPRSFPGWRLCLLAFAVVLVRPVLCAQAPVPDPSAVITNFDEFWTQGVRDQVRPIRMQITVSFYDPAWGNLWAEAGGEVGYMYCATRLPIESHDRVLIEGTVVPQRGLSAETATFRILARNVPAPLLDATGQLADFDRLTSRVVTFYAILDQQQIDGGNHTLARLVAEGHVIHAYHAAEPARLFDAHPGSLVRLTGLYNPKRDPLTNSLEIDIWMAARTDMVAIGDLADDPRFDLALSPIGQLSVVYQNEIKLARVAGLVRAYTPGREITLRDESGQIIVRTLQTLPLKLGEVVEAVGLPFTQGANWLLRDAIVRHPAAPVAVAVKAALIAPPRVLRLVDQILALDPEEAAEGRRVDLTGVVIWTSAPELQFFMRDGSGGVLVHVSDNVDPTLYKAGSGIRITGTTGPGAFTPEVKAETFFVWGSALVPEPVLTTLEQAMTGREEGQRVEMRGYVKTVKQDGVWTRLTLSAAAGEFTAVVAQDQSLSGLAGSIVSLRGVCRAVANTRRQLTGIEIWLAGADDVRVEQAALAEPFAMPLRRIGSLRQFNPGAGGYWARVRGVVTHQMPGRFVFVQDGAEGLMILTTQSERLVPGDVIEATGMPGLESQRIVLREAVFRKTGHEGEPTPLTVTEARVVDEDLESRLVRIAGRLVSIVHDKNDVGLAVDASDIVFAAALTHSEPDASFAQWRPGSKIALTGVYEIVRDERRQARSFRLQLRSSRDLSVLQRPSWWTPRRAFAVTGALGLCIAGGMAWVFALRRRVLQQTEQIRTQILKEANLEARHREIIANASDFIFTTDLAGNFTSFNPAGERITGFTQDEALHLSIRDLIAPEDGATGAALMSLTLAPDRGAAARFETRFKTKDGRRVWVETNARLIHEAGRPAGVLGVVRDIGERKLIEDELKRARDAAQANTLAKSAFLANMSHEIRTPMNGVIGMSNLLLDTPLRADQREFAETIRTSADALLTVLNDILDFSKIEAGKLEFEAIDFDLAAMVDDALGVLATRAVEKRIELAAYIPPDLPRYFRGDPGRLRQVLLNLIGNAVKFTAEGEVVVTVSRETVTGQATRLRFEVADTGIGLEAGAQEQLFQPFMQADSSTTRKFGGTGLGLAISKQIVGLMGGAIGVRSNQGPGSTFWFTVDLPPAPPEAADETPSKLAMLAGVRVLAVDDNPTNRRIVSHYAHAWKMRCDTAETGAEALRLTAAAVATHDPYRLMLLDYQMPETDGVALARALRSESAFPAVPMLLLTSVDRRFSREDLDAAGLADVLTKPIRQGDLQNAILRLLGASSAGPDATLDRVATAPASLFAELAPGTSPFSALRVVVAEDNNVNQRLIQLQLKKLGIAADIASNGREVLAAIERKTYDVVLMDCQMPELDGYEATRRLRRHGRQPGLRVIAMTANAMQGDREKCLEAGMDDYLSKPTRLEDLRAALERAMQPAALSIEPSAKP